MATAVVEPTEFAEYSLAETALSSMVSASTTPPPEPAPSSSAPKPDAGSVAMVVHLACGSIEIRNGANRETIENTLLTLIKLC